MTKKYYWQYLDGEIKKLHSKGLLDFLIKEANDWIHQSKNSQILTRSFENDSRFFSFKILTSYINEGLSESFMAELNLLSSNLKFSHKFLLNKKTKKAELIEVLDMSGYGTQFDQITYPFIIAIKSGEISKLKICKNKACNLFYQGRKNQVYCNKNCGSKFRMKKMRKKDSLRKMD
ncbi:MAG: hypothetical protein COW00_17900 [Bdellovibrio sp. CG12_big_fil_rev_8_21_14_0_65_39_13]|nr:MAG: hypothetical protein COW78_06270 [Bdellovibrio sp. CG22_combo_CG10-13_8_21_14_all_39_27]PIQ57982.1 MAG: hypothetical protein COW00_17900 [Bdellovibrio sp. CG12_big_fil_rev_8_21_14_0_65_39_13]PIR32883.1 MAG: hypothetical protein COV37_17440 [Bdellovibrio sp. CG11_big_fil_rev_8_21_14_0_20_39_38]